MANSFEGLLLNDISKPNDALSTFFVLYINMQVVYSAIECAVGCESDFFPTTSEHQVTARTILFSTIC